jgi:hypothetical protein
MKEGKGFKTIFNDVKTAQSYKDMFIWILKNDKFDVDIRLGYYDDKERIRSYYGFYSSSTLFIVL